MLLNSSQRVVGFVMRWQVRGAVMLLVEESLSGNILGGDGANPTNSVVFRVRHHEGTGGTCEIVNVAKRLLALIFRHRFYGSDVLLRS
jgi:hypothetical protein